MAGISSSPATGPPEGSLLECDARGDAAQGNKPVPTAKKKRLGKIYVTDRRSGTLIAIDPQSGEKYEIFEIRIEQATDLPGWVDRGVSSGEVGCGSADWKRMPNPRQILDLGIEWQDHPRLVERRQADLISLGHIVQKCESSLGLHDRPG